MLAKRDKAVADISIGQTSIFWARDKYGGQIQSERTSDGSRNNNLCLMAHAGNQHYQIMLVSGALGGWKIVTGYEVAKVHERFQGEKCGKLNEQFSFHWIGASRKKTLDIYGIPMQTLARFSRYTFSYQETLPENKATYDVFAGIDFYFDDDEHVHKVRAFEVKSN